MAEKSRQKREEQEKRIAQKRDLGTVGGGTIPGGSGGASPDQPQTSMKDRGASQENCGKGTNEEIIDPMTSRAPGKLQQQNAAEKADQDKEHTEQKKQS